MCCTMGSRKDGRIRKRKAKHTLFKTSCYTICRRNVSFRFLLMGHTTR
ncbi:hypothetical protein WG66_007946, partial [Moniliophthora roreri]